MDADSFHRVPVRQVFQTNISERRFDKLDVSIREMKNKSEFQPDFGFAKTPLTHSMTFLIRGRLFFWGGRQNKNLREVALPISSEINDGHFASTQTNHCCAG